MFKKVFFIVFLLNSFALFAVAKDSLAMQVFKGYCWGCHHQTAQAFGPSFKEIANKRKKDEIIAQITDPKDMYKKLGYRRNSMPAFNDLNASQLDAIVAYILSFKDKK